MTRAKTPTLNDDLTRMERTLTAIKAQADDLAKSQEQLDATVDHVARLIVRARGTSDITEQARVAQLEAGEDTLPERIRVILESEGPASVAEIAERLRVPAGRVQRVVKKLRSADKLRNVGSPEDPRWWWSVGDEGSTDELTASISALLRHWPMTLSALMDATGARRGRISGVIVKLQRSGAPVENLGDGHVAIWSLAGQRRRDPGRRPGSPARR